MIINYILFLLLFRLKQRISINLVRANFIIVCTLFGYSFEYVMILLVQVTLSDSSESLSQLNILIKSSYLTSQIHLGW